MPVFYLLLQRVSEVDAATDSKNKEDSLNEELQDPDLLYEKVRERETKKLFFQKHFFISTW